VLVLGDQLWRGNPALDGFDAALDRVLMLEAPGEATHVWSHQARIALFLSAMRHFRDALVAEGLPVAYVDLDAPGQPDGFGERLALALRTHRPQQLVACEPGEWRTLALLQDACAAAEVPLQLMPDTHFLCSREDFAAWAGDKRELRMEFFYRTMRRRHGVLMDGDEPAGGQWNYDVENRRGYPRQGPGLIPPPLRFAPDAVTQEVIALVRERFGGHPGTLAHFGWAVTRAQALQALHEFVEQRLAAFGPYQDAMWTGTPWGWHALLSSSLNLHLITPAEVVAAAESAWRERQVPLASVEGFIRQVLGWREFIRGVYWLDMPRLGQANHYGFTRELPRWYWTGETRMNCMREAIGQTLAHGFAHHIQRLMVTGQFGILAQLSPQQVCDWYLAVYVDAVEWVELPNTAGMALFANGGRFTSKPYVSSGQYIDRMSNYCKGCAYDPKQRTGPRACPYTTLFWNFVDGQERAFLANPRTAMMARNLQRLGDDERAAIRAEARRMLDGLDAL
jgi:deoxyribodipyrimidine photolyase-related protein